VERFVVDLNISFTRCHYAGCISSDGTSGDYQFRSWHGDPRRRHRVVASHDHGQYSVYLAHVLLFNGLFLVESSRALGLTFGVFN
jgi:hypothetical protein